MKNKINQEVSKYMSEIAKLGWQKSPRTSAQMKEAQKKSVIKRLANKKMMSLADEDVPEVKEPLDFSNSDNGTGDIID